MSVLIRSIEISDHVRAKISGKHHVGPVDVQEACERYTEAAWDDDQERGRRLLIRGPTSSGRVLRLVLYPVDEEAGTWRLATAF